MQARRGDFFGQLAAAGGVTGGGIDDHTALGGQGEQARGGFDHLAHMGRSRQREQVDIAGRQGIRCHYGQAQACEPCPRGLKQVTARDLEAGGLQGQRHIAAHLAQAYHGNR